MPIPLSSGPDRTNSSGENIDEKDQLASQDRPDGMRSSSPTFSARTIVGSRHDATALGCVRTTGLSPCGARIDPLFTMSDNPHPRRP